MSTLHDFVKTTLKRHPNVNESDVQSHSDAVVDWIHDEHNHYVDHALQNLMRHVALHLPVHQFEELKETAAQLGGATPHPLYSHISSKVEKNNKRSTLPFDNQHYIDLSGMEHQNELAQWLKSNRAGRIIAFKNALSLCTS